MSNRKLSSLAVYVVAAFALWGISACQLKGQSIYATLTGTVADSSGAVVPNANITVKNESSGDVRRTVTNHDGYFAFSSLPVGTYTATVESSGFEKYEVTGLAFTGAEKRNLDIALKVGSSTTQVEVISQGDILAPVDSGEKSTTITTKQLQDFSVVGRSAAEFIKVLPGFAISNGVNNRASFTGEYIGINGNGDGQNQSAFNGAFSANGLPSNALDITADGAHVSDPGCNCATPVNPNNDMIQELKVLTSNFSAENSKGPIVLNTVAKAGGKDFHGEGYLFARHNSMDANDWLFNDTGTPRPDSKFFFPGANISGPVIIPGTGFNHNRDKLFFFSGFEYFYQGRDTGLLTANVPTPDNRNGIFSDLNDAGNKLYPGGVIPQSAFDPGGLAVFNKYPLANSTPTATIPFNYITDISYEQPGFQSLSRVDYSISDNTKLFVRYNLQKETQHFPVGLWWRNGNQLPYYTPIDAPNQSHSISASLTHVFTPSLTNEFVFGFTYIDFQNVFHDPSKVSRTAAGYPYKGLYNTGVDQLPSTLWGASNFGAIFNPGGFELDKSKGLFADKYLPSLSDNVSKVWGTHTMKFGFYYEFIINDQPSNNYTNSNLIFGTWAGNSTGNAYADLLTGQLAQYQEDNKNLFHNEAYQTYEFFAQDSWKVTRRLTFDYGIRASHFGAWYDRNGTGFAVWQPSTYDPNGSSANYTGLNWHARDKSIPNSGFTAQPLYWGPRFGLAYDIFGTGKTVFRGGWGRFYYHNAQFTNGLDAPAGVRDTTISIVSLKDIETTNPALGAFSTSAVTLNDDKSPNTDSYSATISQQLGASILEVSYVGNQSRDQVNASGIGTNVNQIPYGTLFNLGFDPGTLPNYDKYRPFSLYSTLPVANHNLYSNYNSVQISFIRQKGKYDYSVNYTYGKALGIVGADNLNLKNDYGPLSTDRRHIFNAAYSVELGNPLKSNKFVNGVVNGWQLSGITQLQSGANLAYNFTNNGSYFKALDNTGGYKLANGYGLTSGAVNGTDAIPVQAKIICDPAKNLQDHQFLNGACFALPTGAGDNGPSTYPEFFGPWFFNSDLSLFKNFQIGESKKIQLRFSGYNFLNHPLWSFRDGGNTLNLNFDKSGKQTNDFFGYTTEKLGHRVMQLAIKFYF